MRSVNPSKLYIRAKRFDSHIESVTSSIEKLVFSGIHKRDEKRKRARVVTSLIVLFLLSLLGATISNRGKAELAIFYPNSCLGGWENVTKATGKPETEEGGIFSDLTSALLPANSVADVYCGDFKGDIPESTVPQKLVLRIAWSKDGQMLGTTTIESSNFASSTQEILDTPASTTPVIVSTTTDFQQDNVATSSPEDITPTSTPTSSTIVHSIIAFLERFVEPAFAQEDVTATPVDTPPAPSETPAVETAPVVHVETTEGTAIVPTIDTPATATDTSAITTATTTEITATSTDNSSATGTTDTVVSQDIHASSTALFEVQYTFDGKNWNVLARVGQNELQSSQFEIPLDASSTWGDLSHLQISIKRLTTVDDTLTIYLDGMLLEVGYVKDEGIKIEATDDPKKYDVAISDVVGISTTVNQNEGGKYLLIGVSGGGQLVVYNNKTDNVAFSSGIGSDPVTINLYNFDTGEYTAIITNDSNGCSGVSRLTCQNASSTTGYSLFKVLPTKDTPIRYINPDSSGE